MSEQHLVNPELQAMAYRAVAEMQKQAKPAWLPKSAFVGAGDPAMMGGDPAAAGGAPPMDPAMGGGAPPPPPPGAPPVDPMAGAAAPPMDPGMDIRAIIKEELAAAGMGGAGAGGEGIKPKIDVNVELMQIKNLLARMADGMGIQIPAQEMVATPEALTQMANKEAPGAGGAGPGSAISPIEPVQPAMPMAGGEPKQAHHENGIAFDGIGLETVGNRAAAIARIRGLSA